MTECHAGPVALASLSAVPYRLLRAAGLPKLAGLYCARLALVGAHIAQTTCMTDSSSTAYAGKPFMPYMLLTSRHEAAPAGSSSIGSPCTAEHGREGDIGPCISQGVPADHSPTIPHPLLCRPHAAKWLCAGYRHPGACRLADRAASGQGHCAAGVHGGVQPTMQDALPFACPCMVTSTGSLLVKGLCWSA